MAPIVQASPWKEKYVGMRKYLLLDLGYWITKTGQRHQLKHLLSFLSLFSPSGTITKAVSTNCRFPEKVWEGHLWDKEMWRVAPNTLVDGTGGIRWFFFSLQRTTMDSRNVSFPMTQVVFPFPLFSSARSFFCFPVRFLSAVVAVCFRNCCLLFRFNGRSRLRIALKISGKPDVYSRFSVDIFSVYSSRVYREVICL